MADTVKNGLLWRRCRNPSCTEIFRLRSQGDNRKYCETEACEAKLKAKRDAANQDNRAIRKANAELERLISVRSPEDEPLPDHPLRPDPISLEYGEIPGEPGYYRTSTRATPEQIDKLHRFLLNRAIKLKL